MSREAVRNVKAKQNPNNEADIEEAQVILLMNRIKIALSIARGRKMKYDALKDKVSIAQDPDIFEKAWKGLREEFVIDFDPFTDTFILFDGNLSERLRQRANDKVRNELSAAVSEVINRLNKYTDQ